VSDGGERLFFGVDYGSAKPAAVVIFVRRSGRVESCPVVIRVNLSSREPPRSELPPWRGESWRRERRRR
jgi:hypothetical protein